MEQAFISCEVVRVHLRKDYQHCVYLLCLHVVRSCIISIRMQPVAEPVTGN